MPVGTSEAATAGADSEGWTTDGIKALCQLHMPLMTSFNAGNIAFKRQVTCCLRSKQFQIVCLLTVSLKISVFTEVKL